MDYATFQNLLIARDKHIIIQKAFEQLNEARIRLNSPSTNTDTTSTNNLQEIIWKANTAILWHEQSEVVQPFFDKLSGFFARTMSLFASFDYQINHKATSRVARSRFLFFMWTHGFSLLRQTWYIPIVTNLEQRWFWIDNDLMKKWREVEENKTVMSAEINYLAEMEKRNLIL